MIWNPEFETMRRDELEALQLRRLQSVVAWVYERVPYYRAALDEAGVRPGRHPDARGRPPAADDGQGDAARHVPVRPVRRADGAGRSHPLLVGHHGQADRGRLHARRPQHLDRAHGARRLGRRCHRRRPRADGLRLLDVHGRLRHALRRREGGGHRHPRRSGQHRAPPHDDAATSATTALVSTPTYALYLAEEGDKAGVDFALAAAARGPVRRRALGRGHAPRDRGAPPHHGHGQLRPLRGGRTGRVRRVRVPLRPAHRRGPLPRRDRGPGDARAARRRARRASCCSRRSRRRPSRCCGTGRRTSPRSTTSRASAAARWCACARCASAPTT